MKIIVSTYLIIQFWCLTSPAQQNYCDYEGCNVNRPTVKKVSHIKGRITTLSKYPGTWVIVLDGTTSGEGEPLYDGPDIVVACGLADSLKQIDQRVIISGELKDSCDDFEAWTSKVYYGHLTDLTLNINDK